MQTCGDPYVKVPQLEERFEDMEEQKKAFHEQGISVSIQTTFGVHLNKDNDKKT